MSDDQLLDEDILAYVGLDTDDEVVEYYISGKADSAKVRNIVDNGFEDDYEELNEKLNKQLKKFCYLS